VIRSTSFLSAKEPVSFLLKKRIRGSFCGHHQQGFTHYLHNKRQHYLATPIHSKVIYLPGYMIKPKVAFLKGRILTSQSEQLKIIQKAPIGWKKTGPPK